MRDSYGMTALNAEIDALDNKIPGKLQLELYAAVQDLLLDRVVWFLRNVDLSQGARRASSSTIATASPRSTAALDGALPEEAADGARGARGRAHQSAACRKSWRAASPSLPALAVGARHRAGRRPRRQKIAEVAATYFAAEAFFRLDRIASAARDIQVADYFDRLALDRALDSIGDAERRLAAAMAGNGVAGAAAVEAWVEPRQAEVERIRAAVHEIANSGLTLSKLSVAASLLGDLVKQ